MININPNSMSKTCLVDIIKNSSIVRIAYKMSKIQVKKTIEKFFNDENSKFNILNRLSKEKLLEILINRHIN